MTHNRESSVGGGQQRAQRDTEAEKSAKKIKSRSSLAWKMKSLLATQKSVAPRSNNTDRILYRSGINNVWMRVCETNWDSLQCYNCVLPVHILVLCCAYISRNTFDSARICSTSHFPRDCLLGCNHSWNVCVQCTSFTRILLSMYLNSPMFRLSQPDSRKGRTKSIS